MQDREKSNTTGKRQARPSRQHASQHEHFPLKDPLPIEFRSFDKKLYRHIQNDLSAKRAFAQMTTGRKALDPSALLLWLGTEACGAADEPDPQKADRKYESKSQEKRAWEKWSDDLEGLESNAITLRRVSKMMKAHLSEAQRDLPGEWGYAMSFPRGQLYQKLFGFIPQTARMLITFAEKIDHGSSMIDDYVALCKMWREIGVDSGEKEIQRTVALLRSVKEQTGRCQFEKMALLVSVGRRLTSRNVETTESLRSMWRRESKHWMHTVRLPQQSK